MSTVDVRMLHCSPLFLPIALQMKHIFYLVNNHSFFDIQKPRRSAYREHLLHLSVLPEVTDISIRASTDFHIIHISLLIGLVFFIRFIVFITRVSKVTSYKTMCNLLQKKKTRKILYAQSFLIF